MSRIAPCLPRGVSRVPTYEDLYIVPGLLPLTRGRFSFKRSAVGDHPVHLIAYSRASHGFPRVEDAALHVLVDKGHGVLCGLFLLRLFLFIEVVPSDRVPAIATQDETRRGESDQISL